jgi:sulfate permease, SulP family
VLASPGIVVYRFEADLFYANAGRFAEEILRLVTETQPQLRWVVVDASEISNIDYTAGKALRQLRGELDQRGVGIAAIAIPAGVKRQLERYDVLHGAFGHREVFMTADAAIEALRHAAPPTIPDEG